MFSRIDLTNFRAIGPRPLSLPLRPLTLLVGGNGAGKSSILQSIALTAQSATEQPRLQDMVVTGTKWTGGDAGDVYYRHDASLPLAVGLTSLIDGARWSKSGLAPKAPWSVLGAWPPMEFTYSWTREGAQTTAWSHRYQLDGVSIWDWLGRLKRESHGWEAIQEVSILTESRGLAGPIRPLRSFDRVLPEQMFMAPGQLFNLDLSVPPGSDLGVAMDAAWKAQITKVALEAAGVLAPLAADLRDSLQRVLLIEPLRGQKLVSADAGSAQSTGSHGQDLLRLLSTLEIRSKRPWERFRAWAERFGLRSVDSGMQADELNLSAVDLNGVNVQLSEVATGSFQGLLLAAQVILAQPESILLIEEPESNMHPAYEKELAALLADGVQLSHQIIATTHSEILVAAVASLVRRQVLRPDQVGIVELSRDPEGISGKALGITSQGLSEWVKSFTAVEATLSKEWTDGIPEER